MSFQTFAHETEFPFMDVEALNSGISPGRDDLVSDLKAALAREQSLLRRVAELESRQDLQARELDHRLFNGLQSIASLLSAQSRLASPEAAAQLTVAVSRIVAFGEVNRRLHLLDHQDHVEFIAYLTQLCADLTALLFWQQPGCAIAVEGAPVEMPSTIAIPLSFIVNELITNSVKHAAGNIRVRLESLARGQYALSVSDEGPGLPAGFDPLGNKGLGMRIVQSLIAQIGGELLITPGDGGRGARFAVHFAIGVAEPAA